MPVGGRQGRAEPEEHWKQHGRHSSHRQQAAGGLLSMGRVTSVLFPVFLWLGAALPATHRHAWIGLFALLQGFVAVMFFTWRPLY